MQNNAIRNIFGVKLRTNLLPYYQKYNLLDLGQITILRSNCFIFKTILHKDPIFCTHFVKSLFGTRGNDNNKLFLPGTLCATRRKSIFLMELSFTIYSVQKLGNVKQCQVLDHNA